MTAGNEIAASLAALTAVLVIVKLVLDLRGNPDEKEAKEASRSLLKQIHAESAVAAQKARETLAVVEKTHQLVEVIKDHAVTANMRGEQATKDMDRLVVKIDGLVTSIGQLVVEMQASRQRGGQ